MVIGIIAAMAIEIKKIKEELGKYQKNVIAGVKFYKSQIGDNIVVLVNGGIGKANIAHATSLLCNLYKPNVVINTGIAGGLDPLKTSDLLLADHLIYHDVNAIGFGYELGEVPGMPKYYIADSSYQSKIKKILSQKEIEFKSGVILTGDTFVTSREMIKVIPIDKNVGIDMEGAAVAQICYLYQIPFVSMRFISDSIDSPNQEFEYQAFEEEAANKSADICISVMHNLH